MGFLNFLGVDPMSAGSPGFAGGFVQPVGGAGQMAGGMSMIEGAGGLENALAQNQARGNALAQQKPPRPNIGLGDILALAGDVLRARNGFDPMYQDRRLAMKKEREQQQQQQAQNEAFANYLGDPELAAFIRGGGDAGAAMKAYEFKHPDAKDPPAMIREWQERNKLPPEQRADYDRYVESRRFNPFGAPIVMGQGDTLEYPGGQGAPGGSEVTATNPQTGERIRLNPQSGQWEPMGGPTPSASGVFPGQ